MPELNKATIGKQYPPIETAIEGMMTKYYALATNDPNPFYIDESREGGIVAPPMYAVRYSGGVAGQVFFDKEVGENFLAMLVHGEQDMTWHRQVKPGETVVAQGKISDIVDKGSGEYITVEIEVTSKDSGEVVFTSRMGFFVRGYGKLEKKPKEPQPQEDRSRVAFTANENVLIGQTYIYAEPSGDHNLIHKDVEFAKKVGLSGIILQGLCTMAFCQKAVVDNACGRDPNRLRRLAVRFSKPVLPGDDLTIQAWDKEEKDGLKVLGFEAKNQSGDAVIKNGIAEVAE